MKIKGYLTVAVLSLVALCCFSSARAGVKTEGAQKGGVMSKMQVRSSAFENMKEIPTKYTCKGQDISPPLSFLHVPKEAKSLVLIADDPDAPDPKAPKMTWVHWVLYNIPPDTDGLKEAVKKLPAGTKEGLSDWKRTGWGGPCPPIGRHRYFFKLYALSEMLPDLKSPTKNELLKALEGKVIAQAELVGTYQK
jgi:Raf kinase inhibitor-like YbhB/YbcL family protein